MQRDGMKVAFRQRGTYIRAAAALMASRMRK